MLVFYSELYGDRSKRIVLESEPTVITFADGQQLTGKLIGKTDDTLFLLEGSKIKALPLTSLVKEIVITTWSESTSE